MNCLQQLPLCSIGSSAFTTCRAKTPNITKKRLARQSMRRRTIEPQAQRNKQSAAPRIARQAASPAEAADSDDLPIKLSVNTTVEAISEENEEDERIMDLEAEVEELREQVCFQQSSGDTRTIPSRQSSCTCGYDDADLN